MLLFVVGFAALVSGCGKSNSPNGSSGDVQLAHQNAQPAAVAPTPPPAPEPLTAAEKQMYRDLAKSAWSYFERYYQPSTGLVNASPEWANTTLWDVGGQLLAFAAARDLGLLSADEYGKRMRTTLNTLERMALFRNAAYNKQYSTRTGALAADRPGWSATDLGRFLVALKVIAAHDPEFAAQAERIARRNDFKQIVKDGYLYGEMIGSNGRPWSYQEGRIGYEQYIARGFQLWGADVKNALDLNRNGKPVDVLGVRLIADQRKQDRLVSEPFFLYGLELGLDGDLRVLAENVLKAQEARYQSTGKLTIASEDAVSVAPEYFYYYCIYCNGKPFVIDAAVPGKDLDEPRWVSTKAAYAWHALMPSDYTRQAVSYVAAANDPRLGWASGVYEGGKRSTQTYNINTAAVLMEVALYRLRGDRPLVEPASVTP